MSRSYKTPVLLPADPTNALEAATKQYVDSKAGGGADDVWIGTTDPIATVPTIELWYNPNAVAPTTVTAWTALSFGSASWTNMGGANSPLQYRKMGDVVQIRGEVHFAVGGANPMATLPAGFRSPYTHTYPLTNRTNTTIYTLTIDAAGVMNVTGIAVASDFGLGLIELSVIA